MAIDKVKLSQLYKSGRGVVVYNFHFNKYKTFYLKKARTCCNCLMADLDSFGNYSGCLFPTYIKNGVQVPTGICVPVRTAEYHVDLVSCWIMENLWMDERLMDENIKMLGDA